MRVRILLAVIATLFSAGALAAAPLAREFAREVRVRLAVPKAVGEEYGARLAQTLSHVGLLPAKAQYYVLVDRNPSVQAVFVYWHGLDGSWQLVGASPASTGRPGEFEHFVTPLGVFPHSLSALQGLHPHPGLARRVPRPARPARCRLRGGRGGRLRCSGAARRPGGDALPRPLPGGGRFRARRPPVVGETARPLMASGLAKLNDPWGDVVNWFRDMTVNRVKYRLLAAALRSPAASATALVIEPGAARAA